MRKEIQSAVATAGKEIVAAIGITVAIVAIAAVASAGLAAPAAAGGGAVVTAEIVTTTAGIIKNAVSISRLLAVFGAVVVAGTASGTFTAIPNLTTNGINAALASIAAMAVHIATDGDGSAESDSSPETTATFPPQEAVDKVPDEWGPGRPNRKKEGERWLDPDNPQGNGVRIDKGDPSSPNPSQRVDHVVVRTDGKVLGPDGQPIPPGEPIQQHPEAHIPLSEWLKWRSWNQP